MSEAKRPLLISMGDPAGVGPELSLQGAQWAAGRQIPTAIVGNAGILDRVADQLGLPKYPAVAADRWQATAAASPQPCIIDLPLENATQITPGEISSMTGAISLACVNYAIDATLAGNAAGIVTGPIHKEAWHSAGSLHPGHTELLAERTGAPRHCMMLAAPTIRCALVTVHVGLAEVARLLSTAAILETIELSAQAVGKMVARPPRVTVLGLNPHAGEGGLFGNQEEERLIVPAIDSARAQGWEVVGPLPPDTAFLPSIRQHTDVFVCMYHDQGLIPLKALAFDEAVNVTLGLPIVRTSVDHGTALDLAWQGKASPSSMYAAIEMAWQLAGH